MNFLILWVLTIISSYGIVIYNSINFMKSIYDGGYKINKEVLKDFNNKTQDLPFKKTFKLSMILPFYNLYTSFKAMLEFSQYKNRIILELKTLGIIEEMTEFEKQEYFKNQSLKTVLINQKRLENATKITIKEEIGESVAYIDRDEEGKIIILYTTGPISRLSKEEQRATVAIAASKMREEMLDSLIQELSCAESDIIENKQSTGNISKLDENKLESIRKGKEELINLKQELIARKTNKEIIEEPKTKSMK